MRSLPESRDFMTRVRKITLAGAAGNLLLVFLKLSLGSVAKSSALIADGIHSLSDLLTDGAVLTGVQLSVRPVDEDHPYGHGKFETIAAVFISAALIVIGTSIIVSAGATEQVSATEYRPMLVIVASVVSLIVKEILFRVTRRTANDLLSSALMANAWHHRSDAVSSVAVLAAALAAEFGYAGYDKLAAIVVGVMIVIVGVNLIWENLRQLTETAADEKKEARIRELVASVHGVIGFHRLRTRFVGRQLFTDVHVTVSPEMTVRESHSIATEVENAVSEGMSVPTHILIHIEPEDQAEKGIAR